MNTNNSHVELGNFVKYVKFEFVQNRKPILLSVACIVAIYIFIGIFMGCKHKGGGEGETILFTIFAEFISCIVSSMAFANMKTKEERIFSLMVPASVEVKFLTRWLAIVPLLFGLLLAAFYIGDLARIAAFYFTSPDPMNFPNYLSVFNPWIEYYPRKEMLGGSLCSFLFTTYFFTQAFYFFGAVLWPKLSFIKTFAVLYVLQAIFGLFFLWIPKVVSFSLSYEGAGNLLRGSVVILIVLTLLIYYLTYLRLRKSQVVNKLF